MRIWLQLFRPWSYVATLAPFMLAMGMEGGKPEANYFAWFLAFLSALGFQAAANLLNTWGDYHSGVDLVPGTHVTTPQLTDGRLKPAHVLAMAAAALAMAVSLGIIAAIKSAPDGALVNIRLIAIGVIGAIGAVNYSTLFTFKYYGLGVPLVSILMGVLLPLAAIFTINPMADLSLLPTIPLALLIGVIMHGNDMRDMRSDRAARIKTFALILGEHGALGYYVFAHLAAYIAAFIASAIPQAFALLAILPISIATIMRAIRDRPNWFGLERQSGAILFLFSVIYAWSFR